MRRIERASWRFARIAVLALAVMQPVAAADYSFIGRDAPDFALRATAGGNLRLSEFRGQVVLLTFWSSRCNPCRAQLAELDAVYATYKPAGLQVMGVGIDDDAKSSEEFARSVAVSFPMLTDPVKAVGRDYQIDALPMIVIIDRGGVVRYAHREPKSRGEPVYVGELRRLLDE